ncbi:MAG: TIGR02677 family protein, partial [Planctomycetota bacterium]
LGKVQETLAVLTEAFEVFTEEAQTFLLSLQSSVELQTLDLQTFLAYKERLIHYLEDFVHELLLTTPRIVELLRAIDDARIAPALDGLAEHDMEHVTRPRPGDAAAKRRRWEKRWQGVRRWFAVPHEQGPRRLSQAGELRNRAQRAIPALLHAVRSINDRRSTRTDRATDLKALARFFLDAPDDHHAHALWRAATGLPSARHLHLDPETLAARQEKPVSPRTPWGEAPPLQMTVTLRRTGRAQKRGAGPGIIDRKKDREKLRQTADREAHQLARARAQLQSPEPRCLSDFEPLSPEAFGELLELLGRALAQRVRHDEPARVHSTDGALIFDLQPVGGGATATLRTPAGTLTGPDHWVHIRHAEPAADRPR